MKPVMSHLSERCLGTAGSKTRSNCLLMNERHAGKGMFFRENSGGKKEQKKQARQGAVCTLYANVHMSVTEFTLNLEPAGPVGRAE